MSELNEAPHATSAQTQRRSGLSARFVAVQAAAAVAIVVVTVAVMQGLTPAAATAQATPNSPVVATTANAATAPAGSVAAVAQQVGPAVVSVRTDQGLGSGVVYDPSGLILTNAHVVAGAQSITIGMVDGRHFAGKVVGSDTGFDVAVIGVVSALNRPVSEGQGSYSQPMVQTDAAINPGNSGGPLLDINGQVIGITTLVAAPQGIPAQGLGFAVPADTAKRIADQLVQSGKVTHSGQPFMGVSLSDINRPDTTPGFPGQPSVPGLPRIPGLPGGRRGQQPSAPSGVDHGALIGDVQAGSPAATAGIQIGDVIVNVDGFDIYNPDELLARLVLHKPGDQVALTVIRGGQNVSVPLTLGEAPVQQAQA